MSRRDTTLESELRRCYNGKRDPILEPTQGLTHYNKDEYAKLAAEELVKKDYKLFLGYDFGSSGKLKSSETEAAAAVRDFLYTQVAKYGSPELKDETMSQLSVSDQKAFRKCLDTQEKEDAKRAASGDKLKADLSALQEESKDNPFSSKEWRESLTPLDRETTTEGPKKPGGRGSR